MNNRYVWLGLFVIGILFSLASVSALTWGNQYGISENQLTNTSAYQFIYGNDGKHQGQVFTIGTNGANITQNITAISLFLLKVGGPSNNATIDLYTYNLSSFSLLDVVSTGQLPASSLPTDIPRWVNISMDTYKLQSGQSYAIWATATSWDGSNGARWYQAGNVYAGGFALGDYAGNKNLTADQTFIIYANYSSTLNINYPTNVTYKSNITALNYTTNGFIIDCWASTDGGITNTSHVACGTNFTGLISGEGIHTWNVYANTTTNIIGSQNITFNVDTISPIINNASFNSNVFEMTNQQFTLNITNYTSVNNASLVYNSVLYPSTITPIGSNIILNSNFTLPLGDGIKYFNWTINGITNYTTTYNQTVNQINFTLCNGNSPQNVSFINITFKNEVTLIPINGTLNANWNSYYLSGGSGSKSLIFFNATANPSYAFCFSPPDRSITASLTSSYGNTGYATRAYSLSNTAFTNSTTNTVLYLLSTSEGVSTSIQVLTTVNSPISGATIKVEKQISGTWIQIAEVVTGDDGISSFFLDPTQPHKFTVTKTGYTTVVKTITPSQTVYTIQMVARTGIGAYQGPTEGMKWTVSPATGEQCGLTNYAFNLTVNLTSSALTGSYCMFEIWDSTNKSVLNSTTGGSATGCYLTLSYTAANEHKMFGRAYISNNYTNNVLTLLDGDALWYCYETNVSSWTTFTNFFSEMKNIPQFGEGIRNEYARLVVFFLVLTILMGILSYYTQYDTIYPGFAFVLVTGIIILASAGGFLSIDYGNDNVPAFIEQYGIALVTSLIAGGYALNQWARSMMGG